MKQVANERVGEPRKYVGPETCLCVQKKERKEEEKKICSPVKMRTTRCVCVKGERQSRRDDSLSLAALQVPVDQSGTRGWWEREGTRKWVAWEEGRRRLVYGGVSTSAATRLTIASQFTCIHFANVKYT